MATSTATDGETAEERAAGQIGGTEESHRSGSLLVLGAVGVGVQTGGGIGACRTAAVNNGFPDDRSHDHLGLGDDLADHHEKSHHGMQEGDDEDSHLQSGLGHHS